MRYLTLALAWASLFALCPLYAQSASARGGADTEEAAPKTGVRFVICSPSGNRLPNPLYYHAGKNVYKSVSISGRVPSARVKPEAGKVIFYDQDPTPPSAKEDKGSKESSAEPKEQPKPVLTVEVPANVGSKSLCIVVPGDTPSKSKTLFLNEADFPKKGVHLINLSATPLQMSTSRKGDFSDKKVSKIAPYRASEGISKSNSWTFTEGKHGEQVAFQLTYQKKGETAPQSLRRSKFIVSERQSQISIVVKDPSRDGLKLLSIQFGD